MTAEIVARVTANASGLSSSIDSAFADIGAKAKANAAEINAGYSTKIGRAHV